MKILFIYNPHSGKAKIKADISDIIDVLSQEDNAVTVYPTKRAKHATELVEKHGAEYDMVVCSGGDGTLSEVINGLMSLQTPPPLGYIPSGTVNDFASNLKLSKMPVEAAKAIMRGNSFPLDIGTFNKNAFSYFAGFGLFTDVAHQTSQEFKNVFGRMAYILEGVKRLGNIPSYNVTIKTDTDVITGEFIFGMITNSATVGGFKKFDGANVKLDDGLFEIMLAHKPQNMADVQALLQCILTRTANPQYMYRAEVKYAQINSAQNIDWTLDGEDGGSFDTVLIQNHKQAISVMVDENEYQHIIEHEPIEQILKD